MIALLRKELGELFGPILLAIFGGLMLGWAHAVTPLAHWPVHGVIEYLSEDWLIIATLLAFACGHSRFGPEYQQRTIAFLDGLPTSRHRVFLVKLVAGALPSVLFTAAFGLVKWYALTASPLPNAEGTLWIVALLVLSGGLLVFAHYGLGLVLSWFGAVGWQALLVTSFCLSLVGGLLPPFAPYYPLLSGGIRVEWLAGIPTIALGPAIVWGLCGFGGIGTAWVLFSGPGDKIAYGPWWIRGLFQAVVYTPPVLAVLLLVFGSTLATAVSLGDLFRSTYRAETEHFRFLATWDHQDEADALIDAAETLRGLIAHRMGTGGPERLDVELTGASEHLGGVFVPGKLQLRAQADQSVFVHELSHAWSHELGAPQDIDAWRFYEEGLASWNEGLIAIPDSQAAIPYRGSTASDWLLAPAHTARSRFHNPDDDYAIGRVWTQAIAELGGEQAPACLVRAAAARPRVDSDGLPWWSLILEDCDLTLAEVVERYESLLPTGEMPDMVAWHAGVQDGTHRIRYEPPADPDRPVACMGRNNNRMSRTQYTMATATDGRDCRFSTMQLDQYRFQVSVGIVDEEGAWRMGPWRWVQVP